MYIDILCNFVASIPTPSLHFLLSENCEESVGNGGDHDQFSGVYERYSFREKVSECGTLGF